MLNNYEKNSKLISFSQNQLITHYKKGKLHYIQINHIYHIRQENRATLNHDTILVFIFKMIRYNNWKLH